MNILISLKWVKWKYRFLKKTSKELLNIGENLNYTSILDNTLQNPSNFNTVEINHIILMDDILIKDGGVFKEILNKNYLSRSWDKGTKIQFKLKINLREYIIISNFLFPTLLQFSE